MHDIQRKRFNKTYATSHTFRSGPALRYQPSPCDEKTFRNITFLKIVDTLPATTNEADRSYSTFRGLKTLLRTTTGEDQSKPVLLKPFSLHHASQKQMSCVPSPLDLK